MIQILGAQGDICNVDFFLDKIQIFSKENNVIVQVFNADMVYGKKHLISSVQHAKRAFNRKTNTTNSLEMEIILYASGERQLKHAIPKMGVYTGKQNIAFAILTKDNEDKISDNLKEKLFEFLSLESNDKLLEGNIDTLKRFGIKNKEINTVNESKYQDLILEKVAMVDIIK